MTIEGTERIRTVLEIEWRPGIHERLMIMPDSRVLIVDEFSGEVIQQYAFPAHPKKITLQMEVHNA